MTAAASARFSSARPDCQLPSAMPAAQPAAASSAPHQGGRKEYGNRERVPSEPGFMSRVKLPGEMRYVVIAVLLLIVASLGSAVFFMMHDRSHSKRMVKALAIRVGLSVALFLFLMAGYYFGLFPDRPSRCAYNQ